jgi:hypothetical protein
MECAPAYWDPAMGCAGGEPTTVGETAPATTEDAPVTEEPATPTQDAPNTPSEPTPTAEEPPATSNEPTSTPTPTYTSECSFYALNSAECTEAMRARAAPTGNPFALTESSVSILPWTSTASNTEIRLPTTLITSASNLEDMPTVTARDEVPHIVTYTMYDSNSSPTATVTATWADIVDPVATEIVGILPLPTN